MARIKGLSKDDGWVLASNVSCDFQDDSQYVMRYKPSVNKPSADVIGHSAMPRVVGGIELNSGMRLWVRNMNDAVIDVEITPWAA